MSDRQIASLESKFSAGNYYDLLQSYKALYFRNASAKKYKETISLLLSGATNFLKYQQWNCAAELGQLLIETYKSFGTKYDDESKNTVSTLFKGFNCPENAAMITFMRDAIKWSESAGAGDKGSDEFHALLAIAMAKNGDYIDAQKHFIFGNDPISFADMLVAWTRDASQSEVDLYIARASADAEQLFQSFVQKLSIQTADFTPLLNYIRFLLLTLQRDALPLFNLLKQKYEPSIARDPMFSKYLEQIANLYYNVPLPQSGGLGSLLSGLFSGLSPMMGGGGNNSGSSDVNMVDSVVNDTDDMD
ncbi:DUF410 family protein [Heterostelium album PN500]|uniref:DUF410 family protein n=1 Tax=Heterostelium pallidum (strain ATCC 26659 / Pp 5 / PN500) TaxID=670386 RepID=D3BGG8_HETP5|nr:DUF410 family protein [Heterostelium album PN500]EFA79568.1 DUF410 family protein [Heterostelium album PN500]|eukprot:XP_020431689.1 DUF410 family protein [Heterostelium album PN500]